MQQHIEVVAICSETVILFTEVAKEDMAIFKNKSDKSYSNSFINLNDNW